MKFFVNCRKRIVKKRRPDQILPVKVWKAVEGDISKQFFNGENISTRKRQLKAKLTAFLKNLGTGTANGEHDPKPELSNIDLIPALKSSDVYASHVMAQKREGAIESIMNTPSKKRKVDSDPAKQSDSAEVSEVSFTKKESRSRCTAALEKIAAEMTSSNQMHEKFFSEQSARHAFKQSRNSTVQAMDVQDLARKSTLNTKAALEMLVIQKQHGLLTEEAFKAQAKALIEHRP